MVISIHSLSEYDFSLSGIRAIRQATAYRQLQVRGRKVNGLVFMLRGKCRFSYKNESFTIEPGAVAYLPYGSRHVLDILTDDTQFYRVDFHVTVNGETVLFSEMPVVVCRNAPSESVDAVRHLATDYEFVQNSVAKMELMCKIFRLLCAQPESYGRKRLAPAVASLSGRLIQGVSCKNLARMCGLSTAQFYEIFKQEYGLTPLAYRNQLILQRACLLLQDGTQSVAEIAEALGFESVAYFSRFFKQHMGVSPSRFAHADDPARYL